MGIVQNIGIDAINELAKTATDKAYMAACNVLTDYKAMAELSLKAFRQIAKSNATDEQVAKAASALANDDLLSKYRERKPLHDALDQAIDEQELLELIRR